MFVSPNPEIRKVLTPTVPLTKSSDLHRRLEEKRQQNARRIRVRRAAGREALDRPAHRREMDGVESANLAMQQEAL